VQLKNISLWDEKFEGHWTLVGYHPHGKITPSSFESYDRFQSTRSGAIGYGSASAQEMAVCNAGAPKA
jgi:hypothetical protein